MQEHALAKKNRSIAHKMPGAKANMCYFAGLFGSTARWAWGTKPRPFQVLSHECVVWKHGSLMEPEVNHTCGLLGSQLALAKKTLRGPSENRDFSRGSANRQERSHRTHCDVRGHAGASGEEEPCQLRCHSYPSHAACPEHVCPATA